MIYLRKCYFCAICWKYFIILVAHQGSAKGNVDTHFLSHCLHIFVSAYNMSEWVCVVGFAWMKMTNITIQPPRPFNNRVPFSPTALQQ